jgi:hypothetical protein
MKNKCFHAEGLRLRTRPWSTNFRHFPFVIPSEVEEPLAAMADDRKTLEQWAQMTDIERLLVISSEVEKSLTINV